MPSSRAWVCRNQVLFSSVPSPLTLFCALSSVQSSHPDSLVVVVFTYSKRIGAGLWFLFVYYRHHCLSPHNRYVVLVPALGDLGATSLTPLLIFSAVLHHRGVAYCSKCCQLCSVPTACFAVSPTSAVTLASVFSSSCCDSVVSSMYLVLHPLGPPRGYETHWVMHGQCSAGQAWLCD